MGTTVGLPRQATTRAKAAISTGNWPAIFGQDDIIKSFRWRLRPVGQGKAAVGLALNLGGQETPIC